MAAGNVNFDELLSTTLDNYRKTLEDNVFSARPLVFWLKQKNRMKMKNGGNKIVVPLLYGQNSTAKPYSRYDTLDLTPQEGITAAEFDWKQFAASVIIDGLSEAQNNGDEEVIDLLEAKVSQTEETILEVFDEMFLGNGTASINGAAASKTWLGLGALIGDHLSTVTTVGGIDSTDALNAWWRSNIDRTAKVLEIKDLVSGYNNASQGNNHPDLGLTTQALYEHYESLVQPALRFSDSKTADAGFQNLTFKGSVIMFDDYVPAGEWTFVNSKYVGLTGHKKNWFRHTKFVTPADGDYRSSQILVYGNMTISNRKRQARLENKTAA